MSKKHKNKDLDDCLDSLAKAKETPQTEKALYIANGLVVALAPIYLYVTIFGLSFRDNLVIFLALTGLAGFLLSQAYEAVTKTLFTAYSKSRNLSYDPALYGDDSKKSGKKSELQKSKVSQQESSRNEAVSYSILYNNLLFLMFVVVLGFYVLKNLPGLFNYILSVGIAGALVMLSSTSK